MPPTRCCPDCLPGPVFFINLPWRGICVAGRGSWALGLIPPDLLKIPTGPNPPLSASVSPSCMVGCYGPDGDVVGAGGDVVMGAVAAVVGLAGAFVTYVYGSPAGPLLSSVRNSLLATLCRLATSLLLQTHRHTSHILPSDSARVASIFRLSRAGHDPVASRSPSPWGSPRPPRGSGRRPVLPSSV